MRIFKNKWFAKFAHKERIADAKLCEAVRNAEQGIIAADYGGGVIKQRIARRNEGKSGGYRSIVLFRRGDKAFFVYGFPKSDRDNISDLEERAFKELAETTFALSEEQLTKLIETQTYTEVNCDDQDQDQNQNIQE